MRISFFAYRFRVWRFYIPSGRRPQPLAGPGNIVRTTIRILKDFPCAVRQNRFVFLTPYMLVSKKAENQWEQRYGKYRNGSKTDLRIGCYFARRAGWRLQFAGRRNGVRIPRTTSLFLLFPAKLRFAGNFWARLCGNCLGRALRGMLGKGFEETLGCSPDARIPKGVVGPRPPSFICQRNGAVCLKATANQVYTGTNTATPSW